MVGGEYEAHSALLGVVGGGYPRYMPPCVP